MLTVVLAVLTGLVAVTDWIAVARDRRDVERWSKPATLLLLLLTVVAAGGLEDPAGVWLVVALFFGMLGDIALLDDGERRFVMGLSAFLVGHLAYLVCFLTLGVSADWWLAGGVVVMVVALGVGRDVLPAVLGRSGVNLALAVATYMGVIAAMTIVGWATGSPWIAAGAGIFVCSDTVLALDRFVRRMAWARPAIMVTYHVGQALIAVGVLRAVS